jgi:tRNA A-37 threonylcarbamoyl transferase component Bud32
MADLVGKTVGKYRIVAKLGRGGMAEVYKAYQPGLDRYVAIKVLHAHLVDDTDFIGRFEREALAVGKLRHSNIVQAVDFDREGDMYFMAMEFIDGPTLKDEIKARKSHHTPFTLKEIAAIFTSLCSAIDYAHARKMVHRDLKPANVMINQDGQVVLTDFGIARILGATQYTQTGALSGTPAYMSPEQGQGERGDERSDIYSLGVMLYELVTGAVPYDGDTPFAVIMKHIGEPLPLPTKVDPKIPESVERVILKAMSKSPADRYQTAGEMAKALRDAIGFLPNEGDLVLKTVAPKPQIQQIEHPTGPITAMKRTGTVVSPKAGNGATVLSAQQDTAAAVTPPAATKSLPVIPLLIGGVVVVLILAGLIGFMVLRGGGASREATETAAAVTNATQTAEIMANATGTAAALSAATATSAANAEATVVAQVAAPTQTAQAATTAAAIETAQAAKIETAVASGLGAASAATAQAATAVAATAEAAAATAAAIEAATAEVVAATATAAAAATVAAEATVAAATAAAQQSVAATAAAQQSATASAAATATAEAKTRAVLQPPQTEEPPQPSLTQPSQPPAQAANVSGKLAFPVDNGSGKYDVFIYSTAGELIGRINGARQPNFRPDGVKLLINGEGGGFGENVFEASSSGNVEKPVSDSPTDSYPFYNPDGNRAVYSNPQLALGSDGNYHSYIFVQCGLIPPAQEGDQNCRDVARFGILVPNGQVGEIQASHPVWAASDEIIFKGCNSWQGGGSCGIFASVSWGNKRGGNGNTPRKLAGTDGTSTIPTDTKGGLLAYHSSESGDWEAYVISINGGGKVNISNSPGSSDGMPTISPDGQWVAFASNREGGWAVFVAPSGGGPAQKLFDLPKPNPWGVGERDWTNERMSWGP